MPKVAKRKRQKHVKKHYNQEAPEAEEKDESCASSSHETSEASCSTLASTPDVSQSTDESRTTTPVDESRTPTPDTLSLSDAGECGPSTSNHSQPLTLECEPEPYPMCDHNYSAKPAPDHAVEGATGVKVEPHFPAPQLASRELLLDARNSLLLFLPNYWSPVVTSNNGVSVILLSRQSQLSLQRTLFFSVSGEVTLSVHCKPVPIEPFLVESMPPKPLVDFESMHYFVDRAVAIVNRVRLKEVCAGADMDKYSSVWDSCAAGVVDENPYKECRYTDTFRSSNCRLLVDSKKWRCPECSKAVTSLRKKFTAAMKAANAPRSSKTANIHLSEEEKLDKLNQQRREINNLRRANRRLRERMQDLIAKEGLELNEKLSNDLDTIVRDAALTPAQSIFWQQQIRASQFKNKSSVRWHPSVIRLALSIFEASRSAYERLQQSGFLQLPTSRTLFDYTHFAKITEGIDNVALESMSKRVEKLPKERQYHVLMADEMYISKNLVINKHTGELVGYTRLDQVDRELKALDLYFKDPNAQPKKEVASKIMAYLVKGVANDVKEVVAIYGVLNFTPRQMYAWTWQIIAALERNGIRIVAFTCDGSSINRAFIKMHEPSHLPRPSGVVYSTVNKAAPHRDLFFISDVPHLLKTLRNSFARSRLGGKGKRLMTKNGQRIVWDHIIRLYNAKKGKVIRKSYKLTAQHVYPDSYSCMKVGPAAQVLSTTVGKDLQSQNWPGTSETVNFIFKADQWFDDVNGPHTSTGHRKLKKRLFAYMSENDWRFAEMEAYVKYLHDWQEEARNSAADVSGVGVLPSFCDNGDQNIELNDLVEDNDDMDDETPAAKRLPAAQTILGIEMATYGLIGAIKFLLREGVKFVNPRVFCQDPLEQYFSKLRDGFGGSTNPNLQQVLNKQRTIHVVGQVGLKKKRGNTEVDPNECLPILSDEPLPKKKKQRLSL